MKRIVPVFLTAIAVMILSTVPMLYGRPQTREGRRADALAILLQTKAELGLTDAQTSEIRSIMRSLHDQNADLRAQRRDHVQDVIDTLVADPSNVAEAQALIDEQAKIDRMRKTNLINATSKALRVLSADQRQKLAEIIAERRASRKGRG